MARHDPSITPEETLFGPKRPQGADDSNRVPLHFVCLHPLREFLAGNISTSVIRKKSNILYFNFDYKFDLQIQIVAIFRKKVF